MNIKTLSLSLFAIAFSICVLLAQDHDVHDRTGFVPGLYKEGQDGKLHLVTNVDLVALWPGIWKDGTNGLRGQLLQLGMDKRETWIRVGVGTVVSNSLGGFEGEPNGKFAKFELQDSTGAVVPFRDGVALAGQLPSKISVNDLHRFSNGGIKNSIGFLYTNIGPSLIRDINVNDVCRITNEGDYKLTVCAVIYKWEANNAYLDRVDLPCLTTKLHLAPH